MENVVLVAAGGMEALKGMGDHVPGELALELADPLPVVGVPARRREDVANPREHLRRGAARERVETRERRLG